MPTPDKATTRAPFLAARRARSEFDRAAARAAVADHVLRAWTTARWSCVAAYEPLPSEAGSTQLLVALVERGVRVLVPITRADRDLDWAPWTADGPGDALGVAAVGTAGLILVPALAVAVDGTRLGRGGGSYDRALPRRAGDALVAALLFGGELVTSLPRDAWDVPVDAAVLPDGWHRVGGGSPGPDRNARRNTGIADRG